MLSEQEQQSDTRQFWGFIKQHYRTLLMYALIGGLCTFILTYFLPKEYKSYGIVYPPSSTSIENSIDFPNFGYDVEADRLMQILESREIRDSVIKKFDLAKHFKVNMDSPEWHDELVKRYFRNIKLERTISMAVIITARTKDPQLSADIVNYIINAADVFREKIYKKNILTAYEHASLEYEAQKARVDSAEAQLVAHLKDRKLSSLLMLLSDAQISMDIDKLDGINAADSQGPIGSEIIAFKGIYEVMKEAKSRMIKIKKTYMNPIPKIYVINYGEPHYKKISPSFTVNTAVGMLFALFITVVALLVKHNSGRQ